MEGENIVSYERTKTDVEEAYRRGFEAGFNVRPNPVAMILRSMWRKHELKKLKKVYVKKIMEMSNQPIWMHDHTKPIGIFIQENKNAQP